MYANNPSFSWTFTEGNVITVEIDYLVFERKHRLSFNFLIVVGGEIRPLVLTTYFRDFFIQDIFSGVASKELQWLFTRVTHLEGSLKITENSFVSVQTETPIFLEAPVIEEPCDIQQRLRVSLSRYNKSAPLYFYMYGIRAVSESEKQKLAQDILEMGQEIQEIENISVKFSGFTAQGQVTDTQFVVSVTCKTEPLPKNQMYSSIYNKEKE